MNAAPILEGNQTRATIATLRHHASMLLRDAMAMDPRLYECGWKIDLSDRLTAAADYLERGSR